jgi:hypothetical protein
MYFKNDLTQEELKSLLNYDEKTGLFTWKISSSPKSRIKIGDIAGCVKKDEYTTIQIYRKVYPAHRLAWFYVYGIWPKDMIDHIDGKKSNNSILNLREATRSENGQNLTKANSKNKLGVLGVTCRNNRYEAHIKINKKQMYLGTFNTIEEASNCYLNAKRKLHPFGTL